mmetsp:Transcript_15373/g.19032  ORF Transcript_15373/g.19032 Transcript_15373/m.19032 type:complete len:91 (-) Transcript_15373:27-299(-)
MNYLYKNLPQALIFQIINKRVALWTSPVFLRRIKMTKQISYSPELTLRYITTSQRRNSFFMATPLIICFSGSFEEMRRYHRATFGLYRYH